ncbi:MAG: hypothetical protein ACON5K_04930 [Bacteroidia bacterium]
MEKFKYILRLLLAILAGSIIGATVNMSIILLQPLTIPLPAGTDVSSMESLARAIPNFQTKHFIMPFLAHAFGTFVGAFVASIISKKPKKISAVIIGGIFLMGGIDMVRQLPSPLWFNILDLVGAYFPMAIMGYYTSIKALKLVSRT